MANDGGGAAPWHQPPQVHYRLGVRRRQHAKGGSRSSREGECAGLLAFSSNFGINTPTGGPAKKVILIRNAAAANLCKCGTGTSVAQETKLLSWRPLGYT